MEMGCRHDCQLHENAKIRYRGLLYYIALCILGLQWQLLAISSRMLLIVGDLDHRYSIWINSVCCYTVLHDSHYILPIIYKQKVYKDKNHIKPFKKGKKRCKNKNCQLSKTLEQGRVVCYTGLDGHRYRHTLG